MMKLRNPRGRIVHIDEPLASYYASRSGWTVLTDEIEAEPAQEQKRSTDYSVREALALQPTMSADEFAEFIKDDNRKTLQNLL